LFSEIQIINEDILGKRISPEIKKWNQYLLFNINNTKFIIKYNKKKEYIIDIKTLFNLKGEKVEIILEINSNII
jgi:hypothetical protein